MAHAFVRILTYVAVICAAQLAIADAPSGRAQDSEVRFSPATPGAPHFGSCKSASPSYARSLGRLAWERGAWRLAAECYEAAGERVLADRALTRDFEEAAARSGRQMASAVDSARSQARQIKEIFDRR